MISSNHSIIIIDMLFSMNWESVRKDVLTTPYKPSLWSVSGSLPAFMQWQCYIMSLALSWDRVREGTRTTLPSSVCCSGGLTGLCSSHQPLAIFTEDKAHATKESVNHWRRAKGLTSLAMTICSRLGFTTINMFRSISFIQIGSVRFALCSSY